MKSKIAPTDIISAELIFKDYVDFEENVIYLTEEVPNVGDLRKIFNSFS
jgi:hypothetical protein